MKWYDDKNNTDQITQIKPIAIYIEFYYVRKLDILSNYGFQKTKQLTNVKFKIKQIFSNQCKMLI